MRKFAKLLTLCLAVVAIITAFTVVALAATPTKPATLEPKGNTIKDGSLSHLEVDKVIANDSTRIGKYTVKAAEDGNIYLLNEYDPASKTNKEYVAFNPTYSNKEYNITLYPHYAMDFDIMTTTGSYEGISIQADIWLNRDTLYYGANVDYGDTLSTVPYEWQHVTYIVEYAGNGVFNQHYYVNGVHALTNVSTYTNNSNWKSLDGDYTGILLGQVRFMSVTAEDAVVAYDNIKSTYFPESYTMEDIATYFYKDGYTFPYGRTEAKIGDTIYDDVNKAIETAGENDTVKLTMNATKTLLINKNLTIDANVYDAEGNATGEFYSYEFKSSAGYVASETETDGILTYALSPNRVNVIWDPECEGECDCFAAFGGHTLTTETVAILDEIPYFPGTTPTFETVNGLEKEFLGWSYENDGTVDELREVTSDDVANGEIKIYPVYKQTQYDIEVIAAGTSTFYFEKDFYSAITEAASGSTLRLHSDVYTECAMITLEKNLTIDLNGHALDRCFVYGNEYEATLGENGEYVCDTTGTATAVSKVTTFFTIKANVTLKFTSTSGGGSLSSVSMQANTWKYNGEMVKREATGTYASNLLCFGGGSDCTLKMDGGISVYIYTIWQQTSATLTNPSVFIDNINYYRMNNGRISSSGYYEYTIAMLTNKKMTISVSNSTFVYPDKSSNYASAFISLGTSGKATDGVVSNVTVKNCTVAKPDGQGSILVGSARVAGTTNFVFDNCILYDVNDQNSISVAQNGTVQRSGKDESSQTISSTKVAEQHQKVTISITHELTVHSTTAFSANTEGAIAQINFNIPTYAKTLKFTTAAVRPVTVNWMDGDKVIHTEKLTPAVDTLVGPNKAAEVLEDDPYRNLGYFWVDAPENGNLVSGVLGISDNSFTWAEEYNFYGVKEYNGETKYIGGIKDVMFNMSYYSNFKYNLYITADENITIDEIALENVGSVLIYGNQYNAYVGEWSTTGASESTLINVTFTVDAKAYTQTFEVSALVYADLILNSPMLDEETVAVANMVRYIKEARLASSLTAGAEFDELIALGNLADLGAKEDYADDTVDYSGLNGYVSTIQFMVDGTNAAYVITLTDEAVTAGAVVSVSYVDGEEIALNDSASVANAKYTSGTRVYDIAAKAIKITVTVGKETFTGTYSAKAYINATDNALAKAMYEFGVAAKAYRDYLIEA